MYERAIVLLQCCYYRKQGVPLYHNQSFSDSFGNSKGNIKLNSSALYLTPLDTSPCSYLPIIKMGTAKHENMLTTP